MRMFLVNYDLMAPGKDYEALYGVLRSMGAKRVLYSQWVLRSTTTPEALRDTLRRYTDENDRLLVVDMTESAWASWRALTSIAA